MINLIKQKYFIHFGTSHSHFICLYQTALPHYHNLISQHLPGKCRWHQWCPVVLQCIDLKSKDHMTCFPPHLLHLFVFTFVLSPSKRLSIYQEGLLCVIILGSVVFFLYVIKLLGAAACMPSCQQPISQSFSFNFWTVVANL